ncbi:MAG: aspartyl protease family protein [Bacteroidota bacterium]
MKLICCFATIFCCQSYCHTQELVNPALNAVLLTKFSFSQYNGGVMVVRATVGLVKDTLHFILDTGCAGISLDSTTCATYHIKTVPTDTVVNGMGGSRKVCYVFNEALNLPGLTLKNLNFHVNDYSLLSGVYGEKIDGIIGYSFFKRYIVKMDFDSSVLEVYSPGRMEYPRGGSVIRPGINRLLTQRAIVRDRKKTNYNFYFDTGAGLCFLMSEAFATDSSVLLKRRKPVEMQVEGMGGKLAVKFTVVKFVQVGKYRFDNVPTYIFDDQSNVTAFPGNGGLMGIDLLRRFNLTINYPAGEIHLLPNSHFTDPFDYTYTGLGIYYEEGTIYIEDVMPDSPGEKAGIKPGDVLIGVNTNFSNNIMQYKTLLQSAKEKVMLSISRNGELKRLPVYPGSIF